ncbi:hypothetical protein Xcel_0576 [Xylanimonas cellulosilytica DSM 15894]|uniref:Uncharacterized protein n=1 Tax=Xylanimonas cellulosilytica (strain DSM 15894 / JCM 12276 / CECT 5975 / KCTC 9989 / LMG 20990 / NBRC 107835 / XIL07) TaxID=446471 RepID=D1BWN3_XYLCX|nr:hypothetical protein [Xylanimonas cellulosilytica]ACZ29615.1 hypothetical protein Xcel_0576 [Xylanimonas cellulosilytica DSM 15894]
MTSNTQPEDPTPYQAAILQGPSRKSSRVPAHVKARRRAATKAARRSRAINRGR